MREWEQYIQFEEERNEALHGRESDTLALHPTNFYMTYSDVALIHECVEACLGANRVELTQLQHMPESEREGTWKERVRWLQTRNRLLKKVYDKLTKEMDTYGENNT